MKALLTAMPVFLRASFATMFQYRGEIILWAVWGVVYPAVAIAMWSAAVAGRTDGQGIQGFTSGDFAAYFLWTMVIGHVCTAWDLFEMGWLVQSGRMSPKLLRPLLPLWQSLADNLAYKILTLVILLPIWLGVAWITQPTLTGDVVTLLLGVVAMLLAAAMNYLWGYNVALAAFWVTRMDAVGESWFGMSLFFGGRLAPMTLMPLPLQWIAAALPFQWIIWFPAAALMGKLSTSEIVRGLFFQAGWLAAGLVVFRWTWSRALKRYSAVGA